MKRNKICDPFIIDVEGQPVDYAECVRIGFRPNIAANITEELLSTAGPRYIRLTCVGEGEVYENGVGNGWYVAQWLDEKLAVELGKSWGVEKVDVVRTLSSDGDIQ